MTDRHRVDRCARCQQLRYIKARRLCTACYLHARRNGKLDDWPVVERQHRPRPVAPLVCVCEHPTVEEIPLYSARQCGVCFRPFLEELLAELGAPA